MTTLVGSGVAAGEVGVLGESQEAEGVRGVGHKGAGVSGTSEKWLGVYGESQEADGVRGVGHKGAGVSGTSEKWLGVYGESQEAEGVRGVGHKGAGVSGTSEKWLGVYGESQEAEGVRGVGHKGAGVSGTSEMSHGVYGVSSSPTGGAGVYGKGRLAGLFDGDVAITGNLTIQGVSIQSWLQRIIALEREITTLRQRIDSSSHSGGSGTAPSQSTIPTIDDVTKQGPATFQVKGSGFLKSTTVNIRVASGGPHLSELLKHSSDSSGNLKATISISRPPNTGAQLHFSANDGRTNKNDLTGLLWSNTFTITV